MHLKWALSHNSPFSMNWLTSRAAWTSPAVLVCSVVMGVAAMVGLNVSWLPHIGAAGKVGLVAPDGVSLAARAVAENVLGPVFDPTSITDCFVWLDAEAGVTADGAGKVSVWEDQTSVGNDAAQGTGANQPAVIADALNGHDVIRFDGVSSYVRIADNGTVRPTAGITVFAVARPSGAARGDVVAKALTRASWAAPQYSYALSHEADNTGYGYLSTTPSAATTVIGAGTARREKYAYVSALVYDGAALKVFSNGTEQASTAATGDINYDDLTARDLLIGAAHGTSGVTRYFKGDVAEVIAYGRALNATERGQVEVYLADKYGLYHASATWPLAYDGDTQAEITAQKWNKDLADAYVAFKATNPGIPTQGLAVWLNAETGVTKDGSGKISGWSDLSPWGNHAAQGTAANQPLHVTNAWADKSTVRFAGNQFLRIADNMGLRPSQGVTIFVLAQSTATGNRAFVSKPVSATTTAAPWISYWLGSNANIPRGVLGILPAGTNSEAYGGSRPATPFFTSLVYNKATHSVHTNGALSATVNVTADIDYGNTTAKDVFVGAVLYSVGINDPAIGDISEVIIYNRALSPTERTQVEGYLADRIGVYHPQAAWPAAYDAETQQHIALFKLNKAQADAFVLFKSINTETAVPESGLAVWLRADEGVTADGTGKTSVWADRTPFGNNAVQATAASQPNLVASAIGGKPALRFNGSHFLRIPDHLSLRPSSALTIVAVSKPNVPVVPSSAAMVVARGQRRVDGLNRWIGPNFTYLLHYGSNNVPESQVSANSTGVYGAAGPSQTDCRARVHSSVYNGSTLKIYNDGSEAGSTAVSGPISYDWSMGLDVCIGANNSAVGTYGNGVNYFFTGDVAEVMIFARALSLSERQDLEIYLADKYGLPCPGATWPAAFDADTQTQIAAHKWTKEQAQAYADLKATSPTLPTQDLAIWLKADSGVTADGSGKVSNWTDNGPLGNHAFQPTAGNQPTLVTSGLNGQNTIRFDGAQLLRVKENSSTRPASAVSIFAVTRPRTLHGDVSNIAGRGLSFSGHPFYSYGLTHVGNNNQSYGYVYTNPGAVARAVTGPQPLDMRARVMEMVFDGTVHTTWSDGVQEATATYPASTLHYYDKAEREFCIGGSNTYGNRHLFNGDIAEVIVYRRAVTSTERQAIELYLAEKYKVHAPGVTWPTTYDADTQTQIGLYKWSKEQADAYTAFKADTPAIPARDLAVWLKADAGVTADGSNKVSKWADQGFLKNDATQVTAANQPLRVTGGLNGNAVMRFNGANQFFRLLDSSSLRPSSNISVFAVAKSVTPHNGYVYTRSLTYTHWFTNAWIAPHLSYSLSYVNTNSPRAYFTTDPGAAVKDLITSTSINNRWSSLSMIYNGTNLTLGGNGSTLATMPATGNLHYQDASRRDVHIGVNLDAWNRANGWLNGDIAEIVVYNRILSPSERSDVELYLANRHGMYHPQATWPTTNGYSAEVQAAIAANSWNKGEADAYAAFLANPPATVPAASDLAVWLKADAGVTSTSGNVSAWADSATGLYTAVPAGAGQPTLVPNAINGKPAIQFPGDRRVEILNQPELNPTTLTVVAVGKFDAPGTDQAPFVAKANDARNAGWALVQTAANSLGAWVVGPAQKSGSYQFARTWGTVSATYTTSGGQSLATFINNISTGTPVTITGTLGPVTEPLRIGGDGTRNLRGSIAEILVFRRALTQPERADLDSYLSEKYGLYRPNATWITTSGYDAPMQARIHAGKWNKDTAAAYLTWIATNPAVPTEGIRLWLRSDTGLTLAGTAPNQTVSAWADQTFHGNHATQPTVANQPVYVPAAPGVFNNKPLLRFNGTAARFLESVDQLSLHPEKLTIIAVTAPNVATPLATTPGRILSKPYTPGAPWNAPYINYQLSATPTAQPQFALTTPYTYQQTTASLTASPPTAGAAQLLVATYDGVTQTLLHNGGITATSPSLGPISYAPASAPAPVPSNLAIGTRSPTSLAEHFNGDLAELLIYDHALTPAELADISTYLATKYAITLISPPAISPASGDYPSDVTATITCPTPGALIRYTLDGSDPTTASTQYTAPLAISQSRVLKARSFLANTPPSQVVSATYYINDPTHEQLYGNINTDTRTGTGRVTPPQPLVEIDIDPNTAFAPADPGDPPQIIILRPPNAVEVP
ncbi:hypothetical protein DB346_10090 [Verrucomicrobia bacterium LW23]|nr:hypothetical protein DB346_10090 [Verrucomicrobia bacterium LW23]